MSHTPTIAIVILNWNRLDLTMLCLESVRNQSHMALKTIVVDNGSTDNSVTWLKKQTDVTLIVNPKNLGFARAINQGFKMALSLGYEYVVSLNNDARISHTWLNTLAQHMLDNPSTGFCQGASMQEFDNSLYDSTGIYLERGFIPNQRAAGLTEPRLEIPAIGPNAAGAIYRASMLVATQISEGEYFDNRFFAYVEDVDFNLRCTLRGYKFDFVPEAKLFHIGSATGNKIAKKKMYWGARNLVWLVYKNAPLAILRQTIKLIVKSHLANLQYLHREQRVHFLPYLRGLVAGLILLPLFIKKRSANLKNQTISNDEFLALLVPSNPPLSNPLRKLLNLLE